MRPDAHKQKRAVDYQRRRGRGRGRGSGNADHPASSAQQRAGESRPEARAVVAKAHAKEGLTGSDSDSSDEGGWRAAVRPRGDQGLASSHHWRQFDPQVQVPSPTISGAQEDSSPEASDTDFGALLKAGGMYSELHDSWASKRTRPKD